jgi:anti-sigma factor RsiW
MTRDERDELILRHLDGETTADETRQVTRLLAEDATFRSRFFAFVYQVARLREMLHAPSGSPAPAGNLPTEAVMATAPAVGSPPQVQATEDQSRKIDYRQIYFNAVLGGAGGLLGWLAWTLLNTAFGLQNSLLARILLQGPLFGAGIGLAVGSTEGILASRSLLRVFRGAGYGAGLGALGGLIGLPLGELVLAVAGGGVWVRAIGWGIVGAFVGTSDGFAQKMPSKVRYGILGGLLGGLVGGATYEAMNQLGRAPAVTAWSSALGLILVGACIGALIGLVESLLRTSYLFFITGRLEGQTRTLDSSRPHTLGSDDGCTIVLPGDPTVAPVHAEIAFSAEQFVIRPRDGSVVLRREGRDQALSAPVALQPGDRVHLGQTRMIFRNEQGKKPRLESNKPRPEEAISS